MTMSQQWLLHVHDIFFAVRPLNRNNTQIISVEITLNVSLSFNCLLEIFAQVCFQAVEDCEL